MVPVRVDDFLIDAICSLSLRAVDVPPMDDSLYALTPALDGASRESVTIFANVFLSKTRKKSTSGESGDLQQSFVSHSPSVPGSFSMPKKERIIIMV